MVPAKVRVPPRATGLVFVPSDTVILEFVNLLFAIEPASCAFVIVPVNELVG